MKRYTSFILGLVISSFVLLTACSNEEEGNTIRFGLAPDEDSSEILRAYGPFIDYLREKTGLDIEAYVGADYTAVVEAINSDNLDIAWFGPSEYILATEIVDTGVEAFLSAIQSEDTVPYSSIFLVNNESDIEALEDIKGKSIAFTDPASTSGHIFGRQTLINEGIDPDNDLSDTIFSGSHDAAALAVEKNQVDVAVISSRKLPGLIGNGIVDGDKIRIIAESDLIPPDTISYRSDLPEDIKEKIRDAFTENTDELQKVLEGTGFVSFEGVIDSDYDPIRDAYKAAGIEPEF